jgi:hypothetical protein
MAENQNLLQINFMKFVIVALSLLAVGLGGIEYQIQSNIQKRTKIDRKVDSLMLVQSVRVQVLSNANDSLGHQIHDLALCVQYLDSVHESKGFKTERAEKRGRFIGGLIKGLFPIL